uniref:Hydin adenylate kinase-like domain-containing protein n=1 Tax=Callorhinchus milii TaxID=7868 RepID=A0A4W3GV33_CALMI
MTPVSKAIARYLGIDLSPESCVAQARRGIALIVYGAPLSGKTITAEYFAQYYGGACLTIDGVVLEAIISGTTQAGLRARELCAKAAQEQRQKESEEVLQAEMALMQVTDTGSKLVGDNSRNFESKPLQHSTTNSRKVNTARSRIDPHSQKSHQPETSMTGQVLQ